MLPFVFWRSIGIGSIKARGIEVEGAEAGGTKEGGIGNRKAIGIFLIIRVIYKANTFLFISFYI